MTDRILRIREVIDRIGVSRSTIYEWQSRGAFPRAIPLGARSIGWRESDVSAWIEARARRARGADGEADAARPAA